MKIHLCLVSDQPIPNLLPVVNAATRPDKVVLAVSADMKKKHKDRYLREVLKKYVNDIDELQIEDPYDIQQCREIFENWLLKQMDENPEAEIYLNSTGGTKPMSLSAVSVFWSGEDGNNHLRSFYVDGNRIIYLNNSGHREMETVPLVSKLKLSDILNANGYGVTIEKSIYDEGWKQFADECFDKLDWAKKLLPTLNYYAMHADEQYHDLNFEPEDIQRRPNNWDEMQDLLYHTGIITNSERTHLHFFDRKSREFANGKWFEHKVFEIVKGMPDITYPEMNVTIRFEKNPPNEWDVAGIYKNTLFIIECKTQNYKDSEESKRDLDTAIYKLKALKDSGGLKTKAFLVSLFEIPQNSRERAKQHGIETIDGNDIRNLPQLLQGKLSRS